jgi:hypothetical protein
MVLQGQRQSRQSRQGERSLRTLVLCDMTELSGIHPHLEVADLEPTVGHH